MAPADQILDAALRVGGLLAVGGGLAAIAPAGAGRRGKPLSAARLGRRLGTLAVLALVVLGPLALGTWGAAVVAAGLAAVGAAEAQRAVAHALAPARPVGVAPLAGLAAAVPVAAAAGGLSAIAAVAVLLPLLGAGRALAARDPAARGAVLLGGVLAIAWVAVPLACLVVLAGGDNGFGRAVFVLMVAQLADAFALVGGLVFGQRPLAPAISPGKTVEGLAVGVVAALIGAELFAVLTPELSFPVRAGLAVVLTLGGLVGDLGASMIKRWAGVKDFGGILPGHGGVLDRADSTLVVLPLATLLFLLLEHLP